jgi:hypothetical protein
MSLKPKLEFGETLLFRRGLSNKDYPYPFSFAVSDRAVFVTREQHLRKESWVMERIPIADIDEITIKTDSRFRVFATAMAIFIFGVILTVFMLIPVLRDYPGAEYRIAPFLLVVILAFTPFMASRRRILHVKAKSGDYKWKPRIVGNSKLSAFILKVLKKTVNCDKVLSLQNDFAEACSRVGVRTAVDKFTSSKDFANSTD